MNCLRFRLGHYFERILPKNTPAITLTLTMIGLLCWSELHSEINGSDLNDILANDGLLIDMAKGYKITAEKKWENGQQKSRQIIAEKNGTRIDIIQTYPMEIEKAGQFTELKYNIIMNLYVSHYAPYPGMVSSEVALAENKKPIETEVSVTGQKTKALIVNGSARYILGMIEDSTIATRALLVFYYDQVKQIHYQFKLFQPLKSFNEQELRAIAGSIKSLSVKSDGSGKGKK